VAFEARGGGFGAGDRAIERALVLASMKQLAVEPVPTPTMLLSSSFGRMKSTAAWATACLS